MEFNQLAMSNAEGNECMLNRVMTKDNIALAALLETKDQCWENTNNDPPPVREKEKLETAKTGCSFHAEYNTGTDGPDPKIGKKIFSLTKDVQDFRGFAGFFCLF